MALSGSLYQYYEKECLSSIILVYVNTIIVIYYIYYLQ